MIELFAVAPQDDAAFLAAWAAEAPPGSTLHRALRSDVRWRFAGLLAGAPDAAGGVLLIVPFDVPEGEDDRFLAAGRRWATCSPCAGATSARSCSAARTRATSPSCTGRVR